jgi:ankyrin repeat protein
MHLSVYYGYLEVMKLLLERGADIHAMNDEGETSYQLSLRSGYREIADYFGRMVRADIGERFDEILFLT